MGSTSRRKQRMGVVISDEMGKSIVVRIDRISKHPVYRRIVRRSTKVMVHDERKEAKAGNLVKIEEVRPISRHKRWRLLEIVK